jgi:hypothetical protein
MGNFTLQKDPCSFLKLCISPWEVLIPFLLCSLSLSALSSPWRLSLSLLPSLARRRRWIGARDRRAAQVACGPAQAPEWRRAGGPTRALGPSECGWPRGGGARAQVAAGAGGGERRKLQARALVACGCGERARLVLERATARGSGGSVGAGSELGWRSGSDSGGRRGARRCGRAGGVCRRVQARAERAGRACVTACAGASSAGRWRARCRRRRERGRAWEYLVVVWRGRDRSTRRWPLELKRGGSGQTRTEGNEAAHGSSLARTAAEGPVTRQGLSEARVRQQEKGE